MGGEELAGDACKLGGMVGRGLAQRRGAEELGRSVRPPKGSLKATELKVFRSVDVIPDLSERGGPGGDLDVGPGIRVPPAARY